MNARLRSFGRFWYDFVIGDDWRIALGVVIGLGVTYAISRTAAAWWFLPLAVAILLPYSTWRATRRR